MGRREEEDDYVEDSEDEIDEDDLVDFDNDPEILELEKQFRLTLPRETGFGNIVIIDGLPKIPPSKIDKLQKLIHRIFVQVGQLAHDWIYMPVDASGEEQKTKGYAFITYQNATSAQMATQKFDMAPFDKMHTLRVCLLDDYDKMTSVSDEYSPPERREKDEKMNLWSWLGEEKCTLGSDQFVIRIGDETGVSWHDGKDTKVPEPYLTRKNWTETYVKWSPQGTYLASMHAQGVILWGKEGFDKLMQLQHPHVQLIEFSPKEKYLITFSPQFAENDNPKDPKCVIVWDVKTGKNLRGFPGSTQNPWPFFKWSYDDKYLATCDPEKGLVRIYETPDMKLLNGKTIKIPGVKDVFWSPSENILTYWTPEQDNTPARVSLIEIPSRKEIRSKNLFNVSDCKIHWQEKGDFLCVKVDRKQKKTSYTNFELFRMREKDIPIEVLEMRSQILAFAWEPCGSRFAIIHSDGGQKPDVSIYQLTSHKVDLISKLEKRPANHLFWSPQGTYILIAGLRNFHGALEFFNAADGETLRQDEHSGCTDVEWDPTGRYVVTSVSGWMNKLETGYQFWTCQGKLIHKVMKDRFYQLLWRPRPESLLPKDKIKEIKNSLSKYSKQYNIQDLKQKDAQKEEERQRRTNMRKAFEKYMEEKKAEYLSQNKVRRSISRYYAEREDPSFYVLTEEPVEELISTTEEVVK